MLALGSAAALLVGVGGTVGLVFIVLTLPLVFGGRTPTALSGLLSGFGGAWLVLVGRQLATGGMLDGADRWLAVGIVPLAIGAALGVGVMVRAVRGPASEPN